MIRRLFAAMYDRFSKGSEEAGMRDERRQLLAGAEGATIEIGAGTGLNLEHYPEAVTRLVLAEPDRYMRRRLGERVDGFAGGGSRRCAGRATALPGRHLRHGGCDAGPVQRARPGGGAGGDRACAEAERASPLPRARPLRRPEGGETAGPDQACLQPGRLQSQPATRWQRSRHQRSGSSRSSTARCRRRRSSSAR